VIGLTSGCTGQHLTGGAGELYTSSTEVVDARCGPLGESHRLFLKCRVELPLDLHEAVITYLLPCSLSDRLHNVTHQIQSRRHISSVPIVSKSFVVVALQLFGNEFVFEIANLLGG
jgi:hypothetical protein